jgi:hypothetical protein
LEKQPGVQQKKLLTGKDEAHVPAQLLLTTRPVDDEE